MKQFIDLSPLNILINKIIFSLHGNDGTEDRTEYPFLSSDLGQQFPPFPIYLLLLGISFSQDAFRADLFRSAEREGRMVLFINSYELSGLSLRYPARPRKIRPTEYCIRVILFS